VTFGLYAGGSVPMHGLSFIPKAILLALICVFCAPLAAQKKQMVVAILAPTGDAGRMDAAQIRGVLEQFVRDSKEYVAVDRHRTDQVMGELQFQRSGLVDINTAKAIGRNLAADFVCASELTREGNYTNINISFINVTTGVVARSGSELLVGNSPAAIRGVLLNMASRITGVMTAEQRAAQKALRRSVTFGLYAGGSVPMGEFGGVDVPATPDFPQPQTYGYDPGFGARFTLTFPLFFKFLALRAGAGFAYNAGANTAYGYPDLGLGYMAFGATGELQIFFDESFKHRGTYIFGGAAINNETFTESDTSFTARKVRLGATAGLGHTFAPKTGKGGWTIELAYHATLTDKEAVGGVIAADHIRVGGGYVF
jgi:hypothetical protein